MMPSWLCSLVVMSNMAPPSPGTIVYSTSAFLPMSRSCALIRPMAEPTAEDSGTLRWKKPVRGQSREHGERWKHGPTQTETSRQHWVRTTNRSEVLPLLQQQKIQEEINKESRGLTDYALHLEWKEMNLCFTSLRSLQRLLSVCAGEITTSRLHYKSGASTWRRLDHHPSNHPFSSLASSFSEWVGPLMIGSSGVHQSRR